MTALTRNRLNIVLAMMVPAAGLLFLILGVPLTSGQSAVAAVFGLSVVLTIVVALNATWGPAWDSWEGAGPRHDAAHALPAPSIAETGSGVIDVSRPIAPWRWTQLVLAPVELLALVWSVPFVALLVMLPIGLTLMAAVWLGRFIVGR